MCVWGGSQSLHLSALPVTHGEVLLLLQSMDEDDEEVLVVEQRGEQADPFLHAGPTVFRDLQKWKETPQWFVSQEVPVPMLAA